jgi:hypothetical protein
LLDTGLDRSLEITNRGREKSRKQNKPTWQRRWLVTVPKVLLDITVEFLGNQQSVTMQQLCF